MSQRNKLSKINANRVSQFLQWRDWFLKAKKQKYWEIEVREEKNSDAKVLVVSK